MRIYPINPYRITEPQESPDANAYEPGEGDSRQRRNLTPQQPYHPKKRNEHQEDTPKKQAKIIDPEIGKSLDVSI